MKGIRPSETAFTVAQGILFRARRSPYDQLLSSSHQKALMTIMNGSNEGRRRIAQIDSSFYRWLGSVKESLLMPGVTLHHILRKRYIEEQVRLSITNGFKQVVVLGGGFDTLAFRLSKEFASVSFIELDHPSTSTVKTNALKPLVAHQANLTFLQVDLSKKSVADALGGCASFDDTSKTFFICEGVLMYLTDREVRNLFGELRKVLLNRIQFLFTFMEDGEVDKYAFKSIALRLYLHFIGEPVKWKLPLNQVEPFLDSLGYQLDDLTSSPQIVTRLDSNKKMITPYAGEMIAVCSS